MEKENLPLQIEEILFADEKLSYILEAHNVIQELKDELTEGDTAVSLLLKFKDESNADAINQVIDFLENQFIIFDLETTGLEEHDQIIEIGAVKCTYANNKMLVIDRFQTFVKLYKVETIPSKISKLTTITDFDLIDGIEITEALDKFSAFCGKAAIIAHNIRFDKKKLLSAINDVQGKFNNFHADNESMQKKIYLDSIKLAKIVNKNHSNYQLSTLMKAYDIKYDANAHHRADYDAEITAGLVEKLIEKNPKVWTTIQKATKIAQEN